VQKRRRTADPAAAVAEVAIRKIATIIAEEEQGRERREGAAMKVEIEAVSEIAEGEVPAGVDLGVRIDLGEVVGREEEGEGYLKSGVVIDSTETWNEGVTEEETLIEGEGDLGVETIVEILSGKDSRKKEI